MGIAANIRNFWDDLFYSALAERLETDLLMARSDAQQLRQDKDSVIADLRAEKSLLQAKIAVYEMNINQRVGIDPTRKRAEKPSFANFNSPPMLSRWQQEVAEHEAQLEAESKAETEAAKAATV
jgi:hypothetical protein